MPREYRAPDDSRTKVYNATRWRKYTRPTVKARAGGACEKCGAQGTICDHIDPLLDILAQGRDPFDPNECQWLCHQCSGAKDGARGARPVQERPRVNRFLRTVVGGRGA